MSSAHTAISSYLTPVLVTMAGIASLGLTFFLVQGGVLYMTSTGKPENLEHAKKVIKNALIGLCLVVGAGTLALILMHAYHQPAVSPTTALPKLTPVQPNSGGLSITDVIIKTIVGVLNNIIQSVAAPFLNALSYFTSSTPLMGDNKTVVDLWLTILGIADGVFVLVIALVGFQVMSASSLGFDELEFKHLLPQIGMTFLLMNTSFFLIDGVIGLSNAMIHALQIGFNTPSVWSVLQDIAKQANGMGLAAMLIMLVFVVLAVILLVYYVGRLVTLYIGAALSPLIALLWLVPGFKDFALSAIKAYITTIFVLFVHVVILLLAASIFAGLTTASPGSTPDPMMSMIVGLATVIALLKTQGVMMQLTYASVGPRTLRKLGGEFMNGMAFVGGRARAVNATVSSARAKRSLSPVAAEAAANARTSTVKARSSGSGSKPRTGYKPAGVDHMIWDDELPTPKPAVKTPAIKTKASAKPKIEKDES